MTINHISKVLYWLARLSRDAQAVSRSVQTGDPTPILKRMGRKVVGKAVGQYTNKLFKDL